MNKGINWDLQPLGKEPDMDLAARLGVWQSAVSRQRRKRGIPVFGRRTPLPRNASPAAKRQRRIETLRDAQAKYIASIQPELDAAGICNFCRREPRTECYSTCAGCRKRRNATSAAKNRAFKASRGVICRCCKKRKCKEGRTSCSRCLATRRRWWRDNMGAKALPRIASTELVLRMLASCSASQTAIAQEIGVTVRNTIRVMARLVGDGLVQRFLADVNGYAETAWYRLTPKGRAAVNALPPIYSEPRREAA